MGMRTELQAQVEQKIGRNLLRYQLAEVRLKAALPLMNLNLSAEGLDELAKESAKKRTKSLGGLASDYLAKLEVATPEDDAAFRSVVTSFVENRNWLAHQLIAESNGLATIEDCRACMDRLDRDYEAAEGIARHALELHQFVTTSIKSFLDLWCEAALGSAGLAQTFRCHAEQLALLYGNDVTIELQLPLLEILAEIMAVIEASSMRDDGWVPFNPVGHHIHKTLPVVPPRLLSVAKQIEHYEFEERPAKPGTGKSWMFRRRRTVA
jgi:hypothetical protein